MRKHSSKQNKTPTGRKSKTPPQVVSPKDDIHGFFAALFALIAPHRFERLAEYRNSNRGRPPELPLTDLLASLLFHFLCGAGTASEHMFQLLGRSIGDGPISDRRAVDAPQSGGGSSTDGILGIPLRKCLQLGDRTLGLDPHLFQGLDRGQTDWGIAMSQSCQRRNENALKPPV